MKKFMLIGLLIASGCSTSKVTYVGPDGPYGSGIMTGGFASMSNGRFSIADAGITCSGNYSSWEDGPLKFPVWCSDGTSGTVTLSPSPDIKSTGVGTIQIYDGEPRQIAFK